MLAGWINRHQQDVIELRRNAVRMEIWGFEAMSILLIIIWF